MRIYILSLLHANILECENCKSWFLNLKTQQNNQTLNLAILAFSDEEFYSEYTCLVLMCFKIREKPRFSINEDTATINPFIINK